MADLSPQFKSVQEARAFVESLQPKSGLHRQKGNREFLDTQTTRALMKAVNIRSWPLQDHVGDIRDLDMGHGQSVVRPHETLHTTQSHLHVPTLQKYLKGDIPEHDPLYAPDEVPYHPEVAYDEHGNPWIEEGHHRLVTSRLNEYPFQEVYTGSVSPKRRS